MVCALVNLCLTNNDSVLKIKHCIFVCFLRQALPEDGIVFYLAIWEVSGKGNALQRALLEAQLFISFHRKCTTPCGCVDVFRPVMQQGVPL